MNIDLDELAAAEAEAEREPITLTFKGKQFTLPHYLDWDAEAARLLSLDDPFGCFQLVMGDDDYERFVALRPTIGDMMRLIQRIEDLALGEAEASARSNGSSRRTGPRSRPTSNASTGSTSPAPGNRAARRARPRGGSTG